MGGAILDRAEVVSGKRPEVEGAGKVILGKLCIDEQTGKRREVEV